MVLRMLHEDLFSLLPVENGRKRENQPQIVPSSNSNEQVEIEE